MLSIIDWGIPNKDHPFMYHMDEWHQLQAVRATFKQGTPNIEGAAHGTIFHFLLSGLYLAPFYLLGIINPLIIKSGLTEIPMQTKIFEILRLNTILFGVLSLFVLNEIIKKYFKINPAITLILFTFTPLWIYLSNYFKYDIALTFWILTAIFFLLRFGQKSTLNNYMLAGIACALAIAVKLSAIPLVPIYIFSFFYFSHGKKKNYLHLFTGNFIFLLVFLVFGIPDILLGKADYADFISSNLIGPASVTQNLILEYNPWWLHIFLSVMPTNFGNFFFIIFVIALVYWTIKIINGIFSKKVFYLRNELFIFISFLIFLASLWQLKIGANGNRLLVLLPFLAILSGLFVYRFRKYKLPGKKGIIIVFIILAFAFQLLESLVIIYIKLGVDVRQSSSVWLVKNVKKGSVIGIENIPIYQLLPDVVTKEFYEKQYQLKTKTYFDYKVIDSSYKKLPPVVIITNREYEKKYFRKSPKKDLLNRLSKEGYSVKVEFKPPRLLYLIMNNELRMRTSGLVPIPTITIYVKHG